MNETNIIVGALLLMCAACAPENPGTTASPSQEANGVIIDGNTVFSIPPTPNANTVGANPTAPTVQTLNASDVAFVQEPPQAGVAGSHAQLVFNSTPDACADVNTNTYHVGEVQIAIGLTDLNDPTVAANTYTYPSTTANPFQILSATYAVVEAPCFYNSVSLQSGQIVLTTSSASSMAGSYSLTFSSGTITGTFNTTESCVALGQPPVDSSACN